MSLRAKSSSRSHSVTSALSVDSKLPTPVSLVETDTVLSHALEPIATQGVSSGRPSLKWWGLDSGDCGLDSGQWGLDSGDWILIKNVRRSNNCCCRICNYSFIQFNQSWKTYQVEVSRESSYCDRNKTFAHLLPSFETDFSPLFLIISTSIHWSDMV